MKTTSASLLSILLLAMPAVASVETHDPDWSHAHHEVDLPQGRDVTRWQWDERGFDPAWGRGSQIGANGRATIRTRVTIRNEGTVVWRPRFVAFAYLGVVMRTDAGPQGSDIAQGQSRTWQEVYPTLDSGERVSRVLPGQVVEADVIADFEAAPLIYPHTVPGSWDDPETPEVEPTPRFKVRDEIAHARSIEPYTFDPVGDACDLDEHFGWRLSAYLWHINAPAGVTVETLEPATVTASLDWSYRTTSASAPVRVLEALLCAEGVAPPDTEPPMLEEILAAWERLVPRVSAMYAYVVAQVEAGAMTKVQANSIFGQFNAAYEGRYEHALPLLVE